MGLHFADTVFLSADSYALLVRMWTRVEETDNFLKVLEEREELASVLVRGQGEVFQVKYPGGSRPGEK